MRERTQVESGEGQYMNKQFDPQEAHVRMLLYISHDQLCT